MVSQSMEIPFLSYIPTPPRLFIFFIVLLSYAFVAGGVMYCTITGMPFMGTAVDDKGRQVPQAIMPRANGQYIGEGIAVGFFFSLGGVGMVLLDTMNKLVNPSRMLRSFLAALSLSILIGSIFAIRTFIGIKDRWYFHRRW